MSELTYPLLLERLFPRLTGGIRWGLDRTRRLLDTVGDPHLAYPCVHVAGTNGKGSVAAILDAVLREHGLRTGLYTSPHLVDFRERIRIDGAPIREADLLAAAESLWPAIEAESPSFFEATTVIAFLAMARAGIDIALVEVGMGGRLDSTNVVTPDVAVITNVAMDHAEYLGDDLPTIAGEKAGIIKPGVPVVTAAREPEVLAVIRAVAEERGAPVHHVPVPPARVASRSTSLELDTVWGRLPLTLPLAGRHQAENLAVAIRTLELMPASRRPTREAVVRGVAATEWPGRLQYERVRGAGWLFDVAHNAAGVASLLQALPDLGLPDPRVAVIGVLGDKQWERMLPPLFAAVDRVFLVEPPSAPETRRWDPEAVLRALGSPPGAEVVRPFAAALSRAAELAGGGTVLCTGSVHTVGDALATLGLAPFAPRSGLQGPGGAR